MSIDSRRDDPPAQALGLGLRGPAAVRRGAARPAAGPLRRPRDRARRSSRLRSRCEQLELPPPRVLAPQRARGDLRERRPRARLARARQVLLPTSCAAFAGASTILRTSSRARARRPTSSGCSSGARRSASRRSPTAAAPPSSAASAPTWRPPTTARSRSTCGRLDRVLEVDEVSRAARIQGGALGPALEAQLGEHSLTLRHFPQSFEFSTLGGWIATRAAGHFATVWTHIEDFVESVRAITPAGVWESRRLPGSGAGVSPDRMLAGSEGTLGVITEAWVRVQPRPSHRRSAGVRFESFLGAAECVRAISQSGLQPRELPSARSRRGAHDDGRRRRERAARARLRVDRPSRRGADGARAGDLRRARRRRRAGRERPCGRRTPSAPGARRSWAPPTCATRSSRWGCWRETFETAITWERFPAFHEQRHAPPPRRRCCVQGGAGGAGCSAASRTSTRTGRRPTSRCSRPRVAVRRSSSGRRSSGRLRRDPRARAGRSPTTTRSGATTGPGMTASARSRSRRRCAAAKAAVDPRGIMNPGVLIDPLP